MDRWRHSCVHSVGMSRPVLALALATWLCGWGGASSLSASEPGDWLGDGQCREVLHYDWKLTGALSALAGLFLPSRGVGTLATGPGEEGRIVTELRIESPQAGDEGEFWEYGAEIEPTDGDTERVWSAYRWRGEESSERETLDDGIVDVVSGIWTLRREPPESPRRMEIWSDGKLYPVLVLPGASERRVVCGQPRTVRHVEVRGVRVPDRRYWKGSLELWLADDAGATPTRIVLDRGWARVRMDLADDTGGAPAASCDPGCGEVAER